MGLFFKSRPNKLTTEELQEMREYHRLVNNEIFKYIMIRDNTALIPNGKKLRDQQGALVEILKRTKGEFVGRKLIELGYKQGENTTIDLNTGEIKVVPPPKPVETPKPVEEPKVEPQTNA